MRTLYLCGAGNSEGVRLALTINRHQRDSELLCGVYRADRRTNKATFEYLGLVDDPTKYELTVRHRSLLVSDEGVHHPREARDHRELVLQTWKQNAPVLPRDALRLEKILDKAQREEQLNPAATKAILKSLLWVLADVAPVPVSILLFAKGVAGVHNAYRAHRLAQDTHDETDARAILDEIQNRIDHLPPEQARAVLDLLPNAVELLRGRVGDHAAPSTPSA